MLRISALHNNILTFPNILQMTNGCKCAAVRREYTS